MSRITKEEVKQRVCKAIVDAQPRLRELAESIMAEPELGFKEVKTSKKVQAMFDELGISYTTGHALTGVKGRMKGRDSKYTVAMVGELDAILCPRHPRADDLTGAAHCCGHNVQITNMFAVAMGLQAVMDELAGDVVLFAVPAEEYGEIEFKNQLTKEGKIRYGGGKCELIRIGAFDDIDLDIVHHTEDEDICVGATSNNGFVSKVIRYKGVAAHAAGAPYKGINALNAASLGLSALAYQRETFKDEDHVRVHPIITKGGNLVNVVPDEVVIETLVRASNKDAIADAAFKTDRAFKAGAAAIGATCQITTAPGYLPTLKTPADEDVFAAAKIAAATSEKEYTVVEKDISHHSGGSTDVGDVQHIHPVLTFNTGGKVNGLHTVDFDIVDEELAYIVTAKIFALSAYRLLRNGAVKAKEIVKNYHPVFTKEEYIQYMDSFLTYEEQKN